MLGHKVALTLFAVIALLAVVGMMVAIRSYSRANDQQEQSQEQLIASQPPSYWARFVDAVESRDKIVTLLSSVVIAAFTIALVIATFFLFWSSEKVATAAKESADAATKAANVAEQSLTSTQRAYVFLKYAYASPVFASDRTIAGWDFHVVWENAGPTPTQHMVTYRSLLDFPASGMPGDWDFPNVVKGPGEMRAPPTFIGPKGIKDTGGMYVPLPVLKAVEGGSAHLYMWGWAEYGDVFRKAQRSRSEFCFEIVTKGDVAQPPSDEIKPPFDFVACDKHNGSEDECYRRVGNEIPILRLP